MLDLQITATTGKEFVPALRRQLRRAHRILDPKLAELSVALVNDRVMSNLHFQFMGITGPTDVLTFPLEMSSKNRARSGEVVVCVPEAVRQAKLRRIPAKNEVLLYAVHGMLHLCGFDDRTETGHRRMHRMEDQILTQLGVGPVFAARNRKRDRQEDRPRNLSRNRRGTPS